MRMTSWQQPDTVLFAYHDLAQPQTELQRGCQLLPLRSASQCLR